MTFHRLIAEHGSASAALDALPEIAAAAGIKDYGACTERAAADELAAGHRAGARLLRVDSPEYPALLREIPDAPPVLWVRGAMAPLYRSAVAVVGSRNASSLGLRMARGLARALAEKGVTVTAGLARGVDTAAHEASCESGTIAVMAGGIDVIYPRENKALADRICETGCLLSEQAPGVEPVARHFPARNRIVSGLCAGVVVVEAAHRSGTLITARLAAEQGREVMAVPGHPIDARASGCNALIRDGATLIRNAEDVLSAIRFTSVGAGKRDDDDAFAPTTGADHPTETDLRSEIQKQAQPARMNKRHTSSHREHLPPLGESAITAPQRRSTKEIRVSIRTDSDQSGPRPRQISMISPAYHLNAVTSPPFEADAKDDRPRSEQLRERLIGLLSPSPTEEDQLIRDLGTSPAQIAPLLLDLELDGQITRMPGGRIALIT